MSVNMSLTQANIENIELITYKISSTYLSTPANLAW